MVGVADAMTHLATLEESRINIVVVRLALSFCDMSYLHLSEAVLCVCVMLMPFLNFAEERSYGGLFETGILILDMKRDNFFSTTTSDFFVRPKYNTRPTKLRLLAGLTL